MSIRGIGRWSVLALFALDALLSGCVDTLSEVSFATAREARDAGYVDKGWIPSWFPDSATDIREAHDLDTSVSLLAFSVPDARALVLPDTCLPVEYAQTFAAPLQRSWWPDEDSLRTSYVFFRCTADATRYRFVGVNVQQARVVHWRTYGD